jgi:hypothetical protein
MTRFRLHALALLVFPSPACGGNTETRSDGGGGTGAVSRGGTGGSGADGCGADGGSYQCDWVYSCPASPYPEPPAAVIGGDFPPMSSEHRMGRDEVDVLGSVAPLPDGGFATILLRGMYPAMSFSLTRTGADGSVFPLFSWPGTREHNALVRADAQGNLVVAGVATSALTIGDASFVRETSEDVYGGFIYLVTIDPQGALVASKTFAFRGELSLEAASVSPSGEIALAGQVTGELAADTETIASPVSDAGELRSGFALRLDPEGALVSSRLFHATLTHNDPPPLDGSGGTDGFGRSSITDVAFWPDGALVVTGIFSGGIVVGDERLPNDGDDDGLIVTLDEAGEPLWTRHVHGRIGETIPNTGGSGGVAGTIPPGVVGALRVGLGDDGKMTVTGPLAARAMLENEALDTGTRGFFSAVLDRDGAVLAANSDGGSKVVRLGSTGSAFWDGGSLVLMDDLGTELSSLTPGGQLLSTYGELVRGDNLLFSASFLGRIDLGSVTLDSAGCADTFVAAFGLPAN